MFKVRDYPLGGKMKEIQLDMFEELSFVERMEFQKIHEIEVQQSNLRKGLFRRYNEHSKRIQKLEEMLGELTIILKLDEERKLEAI